MWGRSALVEGMASSVHWDLSPRIVREEGCGGYVFTDGLRAVVELPAPSQAGSLAAER